MKRIATLILVSTLAIPMTYAQPAPPSVKKQTTKAEVSQELKERKAELETLRTEARELLWSIKKQQKEIEKLETGKAVYVTAYVSLALLFYSVGRGHKRKDPGHSAYAENLVSFMMLSVAGIKYHFKGEEIKIHKDNIDEFQRELVTVNGKIDDEIELLDILIKKVESL